MSEKPKVLIVEDGKDWIEPFQRMLGRRGVEVLIAGTIEDAERLFTEHPDITLIMMDACVPGDRPTTIPLTRKIRETFKGPMIAMSGRAEHRQQLLNAGCDHECRKDEALGMAKELLGL